jgi:hypothetical protein
MLNHAYMATTIPISTAVTLHLSTTSTHKPLILQGNFGLVGGDQMYVA